MACSGRDLFIDMVVDRFISKTNQITLCSLPPVSPSYQIHIWDYLKHGVVFTVLRRKTYINANSFVRVGKHFFRKVIRTDSVSKRSNRRFFIRYIINNSTLHESEALYRIHVNLSAKCKLSM